MEVVLNPSQRVLQVQPGANLLEVLLEHKVPMSYSCRAGRCGTCRCKVVDGDVLDGGRETRSPQLPLVRVYQHTRLQKFETCRFRFLNYL